MPNILKFQALTFEGAGSYYERTPRIPLAHQGVVLIRGPVGAGKTMIPEVITLTAYGKGSPRIRTTGLSDKTIVNDQGYLSKLEFITHPQGQRIEIQQAFKHRQMKSKYIIGIDGVREEPETKPQQRALVRRLCPLSYDEWLGVGYLPQIGLHDLLTGTPNEKGSYITSAFGLDFYLDLIQESKAELSALEKRAANGLDLERRRADLDAQIASERTTASKIDIKTLTSKRQALNAEIQTLTTRLGAMKQALKSATRLADLQTKLSDMMAQNPLWKTLEGAAALRVKAKTKIPELRAQVADLTAAQRVYRTLESKRKVLETDIEKLIAIVAADSKALEACEVQSAAIPAGLATNALLLQQQDNLSSISMLRLDQEARRMSRDPASLDLERAVQEAAEVSSAGRRLRQLESVLGSKITCECPTCGSELARAALAEMQNRHAADLMRADLFAERTAGALMLLEPTDIQTYLCGKGKESVSWKEVEKRLLNATSVAKRLVAAQEKLQASQERLQSARESLEGLGQGGKPVDQKQIDDLTTRITKAESAAEAVGEALALGEQISALEATQAAVEPGAVDLLMDEIKALESERDQVAEQLSLAANARARLGVLEKQYSDLDHRVAEHTEVAVKIKHYEDLLIPYFTHLRAAKVQACMDTLRQTLPRYLNALVPEAEVEFRQSDDLSTSDMLLRSSATSPMLSVLQSSGGQGQTFTLALYATLHEICPRKANLMFFDEPFRYLGSDEKHRFLHRMLPMLRERCPDLESMFLISHDQEILTASPDSFTSVWNIERDEHGSRIEGL